MANELRKSGPKTQTQEPDLPGEATPGRIHPVNPVHLSKRHDQSRRICLSKKDRAKTFRLLRQIFWETIYVEQLI
jgi:hypothetical protein